MRYKKKFLLTTIFIILFCLIGFVIAQTTQLVVAQDPQSSATSTTFPTVPNNEPAETGNSNQPNSPPQSGTVEVRFYTIYPNSETGSPNPTVDGSIAGPTEAPRVGMVCGGNSEGKTDCKSFDEIVISGTEIFTQTIAPASIENQQTSYPGDSGNIPEEMLYRVIDKNLLYASKQALSSNPKFIFHIKIYFEGEGISWEKTIPRLENEIGITIREINKEAKIIYADAEADKIRPITTEGYVSLVEFDPAFPLPNFPAQKVSEKQIIQRDSIKATVVVNNEPEELTISKKTETKGIVIESNGVRAETSEEVKIDGNGLSVAGKQINVLPYKAVQNIETESNVKTGEIGLKLIDDVPVYEINAVKKGAFLLVIPIEMNMTTTVNAQTGEVEKVEGPWWSFMVG